MGVAFFAVSEKTKLLICLAAANSERVKVSHRIACKSFYHKEKFLTIFTWLRGGRNGRKGRKVSLLPFRFLLLDPINERRNGKGRRKNNQNCFYSFSQKVCQNPPRWGGEVARFMLLFFALLFLAFLLPFPPPCLHFGMARKSPFSLSPSRGTKES